MPRKSRDFYLSNFYHIMVQGDEKKFIFSKGFYKDKYIYLLKRNSFRNDITIIAYCIMDNHAHILFHSKDINRIIKTMLQCNTSYGLYYSRERKNIGHVFRDRYRSEPIFSREHLLNCIKYIHENPIKAKITKTCDEYSYSSFNDYINKIQPFYDEIKERCKLNHQEYLDITNNTHTNIEYIDDIEKENLNHIFNELQSKYNMNNLTEKEIVEIYLILKEKCKVTKTQAAKLLKLNRTTFIRKLQKNSCFE